MRPQGRPRRVSTRASGKKDQRKRAKNRHHQQDRKPVVQTPKIIDALATAAERTAARKAKVLNQYRRFGSVGGACAAAGIARRTFYNWLEADREFAGLLQNARDDLADELEEVAMQRATAPKGSDRLLILLLRANRPWKYRENATVTSVSPIVKEHVRETVHIIRAELPKADADRVLARLSLVWK
jgi:hypothetical protein